MFLISVLMFITKIMLLSFVGEALVFSLAINRLAKMAEFIEKLTVPAHLKDSSIFIEHLVSYERCTPSLALQVVLLSKCVKKSSCNSSYRTSVNFQPRLNSLFNNLPAETCGRERVNTTWQAAFRGQSYP